jgi:thiol-disulfide isomerase/thioredoxin
MNPFNDTNVVFFENSDFDGEGKLDILKNVVIMVYGEGCPHCHHVAPTFATLADEDKSAIFGVIPADGSNVDKQLVARIADFIPGIRGVPTIVLFKNGAYSATYKGDRSKDSLKAFAKG